MGNAPKIVIFKGVDGLWYFRAVAPNGKIVAQSEGYARKYNAEVGIQSLKDVCRRAKVVASSIFY